MVKQTNLRRAKAEWLKWFEQYGAKKFLDSFLRNVEGAESVCVHCGQKIYVDVLVGCGVPDWSTSDGDFGCDASPDTGKDGTGGHSPRRHPEIMKNGAWS